MFNTRSFTFRRVLLSLPMQTINFFSCRCSFSSSSVVCRVPIIRLLFPGVETEPPLASDADELLRFGILLMKLLSKDRTKHSQTTATPTQKTRKTGKTWRTFLSEECHTDNLTYLKGQPKLGEWLQPRGLVVR